MTSKRISRSRRATHTLLLQPADRGTAAEVLLPAHGIARQDPDAVVANTSGLGFPVTTNAKEIATFLRRRSGARVVSSTYQSWPEIAKALRLGRVPGFDWSLPMSGVAAPPDPSHLTSAPC